MDSLNVLIVDDDEDLCNAIRLRLVKEARHFSISIVTSGEECVEYLKKHEVDCILSDCQMAGMDGMELLNRLKSEGSDIPFIFVTGQGNEELAREAFKNGAYDYFTKDIGFAHFPRIINSIEQSVRHRTAERSEARAEEELRQEKDKLDAVLASIGDGISIQDTSFRVMYQNRVQKELFGEQTGGRCYEVYENSDRICENCPVAAAFRDGGIHRVDKRIFGRDGKELHIEITASPLREPGGKIIAGIETVRDITARKRAEEALAFERSQLLSIFDSINAVVYVSDPFTHEILYANKTVKELLKKDPVGALCYREFQGADSPCVFCTNGIILSNHGQPHRWEYHNPVTNLDYVLLDRIIRWPDGRDVRFEIATDVTELKKAEEKRAKLESIAEAVNTMDNIGYVFSGIRHEIGSPINSLKMTLSLLAEDIDKYSKGMIKEYIEKSLQEIGRVEYLLNSLKSFNMYESPTIGNERLDSFILKFQSLVEGDLEKKGVRLDISIAPEVGWVCTDPRALQQVLLNILANASDASEGREGSLIRVAVFKEGGLVKIEVKDNGHGMTKEQQENLFKPFYTSKAKGTGLGLVIAKKMLARMNSTIEVRSRAGVGTTVGITVPEGFDEDEQDKKDIADC